MAEATLTEAAFEALEAEANSTMMNAIGERHRFRGEREGEKQHRILLACADVLGELNSKRLAFRAFDHTIPEEEKPEIVAVEFTDEAIEWLKEARDGTKGNLEWLETSCEGELDYCRREAFLLRVLDRVVGSVEREAVAA